MTQTVPPDALVSVSASIAQHDTMTYAELLEHFEHGHPQRMALIAALEAGQPYDLDGLDIRLVSSVLVDGWRLKQGTLSA